MGARRRRPKSRCSTATYYDDADLRLIRAGVTLRHRTGDPGATEGRWTAKLPSPDGVDERLMERFEIDVDGPPGDPPEQLVSLVRGRLRTGALVPVARLETCAAGWCPARRRRSAPR